MLTQNTDEAGHVARLDHGRHARVGVTEAGVMRQEIPGDPASHQVAGAFLTS